MTPAIVVPCPPIHLVALWTEAKGLELEEVRRTVHTNNICAVGDGPDEIPLTSHPSIRVKAVDNPHTSYPKRVVDYQGDTMIMGYLPQISRT